MMILLFKVTRKASELPWLLDIKNKRCDASRLSNPPPVNTNSTPSEISNWKINAEVVRCHEILFKHDSLDGSATFMSKIIDKVWPIKKKAPKVHIAYAISVCEFILNPKNKKSKYLNSQLNIKYLNKLVNKERISNSDDEQEIGQVIEDKGGQEEGD